MCFSNVDCRSGLSCEQGLCLDLSTAQSNNNSNSGSNGTTPDGITSGDTTANQPNPGGEMREPSEYRYVLVEDTSNQFGGESPGPDLDAISIIFNETSEEVFASTVVDFELGMLGTNLDIEQVLGPPDSGCEPSGYVSLGGGYVMVGFGIRRFSSGDLVLVYELGPGFCPNQQGWVSEDYTLAISISDAQSTFVEIGQGASGAVSFAVP
ncbi:MAG: hypothetical protein AAFS10_20650 [Myxococcota bacterium]